MVTILDTGFKGSMTSLANIQGAADRGQRMDINSVPIETSTNRQVLQSNPARLWAILQNINSADITVFFGDVASAGVAGIRLAQYGSIVINKDIPWAGAMTAFQDSGSTINLFVMEASVQP